MSLSYSPVSASANASDPSLDDVRTSRASADNLATIRNPYRSGLKRALDVVLVCLTLPFAAPFILLMALLVALDGGRPFYSQPRVGRHGRIYTIWKIRSMVIDADAKLDVYLQGNPQARAEWSHSQKLRFDPRITKVGKLLRKTSIDELPQIWNVLRGDMSLVGPRPMMPEQRSLYPGQAYYALRPGITGFWQVSDRNNSSFSARADFDADYHKRLSFLTDMQVLAKTATVVLRGTGC